MMHKYNKGISAPLASDFNKRKYFTSTALRLLMVAGATVLLSGCVSSGGGGGGGEEGGGGGGKRKSLGGYKYLSNPTTGYNRPNRYNYAGDRSHTGSIGLNKNVPKSLSGTGYKVGIMERDNVYSNDDYLTFSKGAKVSIKADGTYDFIDDEYTGDALTFPTPTTDHSNHWYRTSFSHSHSVSSFIRQVAQEANIVPIIGHGVAPSKAAHDYGESKNLLAINFSMNRGKSSPIEICANTTCTLTKNYGHSLYIGPGGTDYSTTALTESDVNDLRTKFNKGGSNWLNYHYSELSSLIAEKTSINSSTYNKYHDYPIIVQAAGNESAKHSTGSDFAYYVAQIKLLALSVTSFNHSTTTSEHGKSSSFANECGILKSMCLAAPGNNVKHKIKMNGKGERELEISGTSFSAPIVTGAFALLAQRFPPLTTREIRDRILKTASHTLADGTALKTKTGGAPALDSNGLSKEFGHGALRVDLAVNPVGVPQYILKGTSLRDKVSIPVGEYALYTSKAFGGGITKTLSEHKVTVFDSLDAPFVTSLGDIANADYALDSPNVYMQKPNYEQYQYSTANNQLSFIPRGVSHTQAIKSGFYAVPQNQGDLLGEHLNYSGDDKGVKTTLSASLNKRNFAYSTSKKITFANIDITPKHQILWEQGALLGTSGKGKAGLRGHSVNNFLTLDLSGQSGTHKYGLQATKGYTQVFGIQGGMVKLPRNIQSQSMSAYALHQCKDNKNTGLGMMMPLRVTHAKAHLNYVTARDKRKNLTYNTTTVSLAPKGKQINYELFHSLPFEQGTLRLGGLYMHDKNHEKNNNQWQMGISVKWEF